MPWLADDTDTIAAIATPRGVGGIGVIRVSGSYALACVRAVFRPSRSATYTPTRSHAITHGHVIAPSTRTVIDEALVSYYREPTTYTGEEMLEVSVHGGPVVLDETLAAVCEAGARIANPGEFTQRAFLNGRMDLAQAEAVADIIHAKTRHGRRAATAQLDGALSRRLGGLRDRLVDILAEVEAHVDFPEDDLDFEPAAAVASAIDGVAAGVGELLAEGARGQNVRDGIDVAIVGKPNVGKSSLLNALLKDDRAIVTATPGTTRDVVEGHVDMCGVPVRLADTAGMRDTNDEIEREGVTRSRRRAEHADVVVGVLDLSQPVEAEDREILALLAARVRILVANKADLVRAWEPEEALGDGVVVVSATLGDGLPKLVTAIASAAAGPDAQTSEPPAVTNARHVEALRHAAESLGHARRTAFEGLPPELIAVDLRGALNAVGLILGDTATEDVLERIFSQFCIGK
ncbi:tRNA uridine-5-carboxymethylaminomethyl(34) synthesis GTPase MnmE [Candidatus Poribacteria bacterium]|jgi:tRNA modification GTPase|nr:tRNA uridine-5-carboxymethylaminomethyl(34) synthesis GTPase MnmE [Candidatus Poribacteria bacterium]MBT5533366.1 tRNA uridine-5-carboxymethylaminomethyl(34) synthesis GTPase MnmE [Candidatus Poribacteria bacterium]MBT7807996.1 tRNA uridine-5-carboxymethylaminomethyl(34) synthesis GTPase MnmE [Candidatus Poribacteria bacterium]